MNADAILQTVTTVDHGNGKRILTLKQRIEADRSIQLDNYHVIAASEISAETGASYSKRKRGSLIASKW